MNLSPCFVAAFICTLGQAHAEAGVITPVSSNRVVSVVNRETNPQTFQSFTGPTLGTWQAQAYASNDSSQPNWNPFGSIVAVTSSQQSNFTSAGVTFSGFVFIDYGGAAQPNPGVSASNRCDTVFHVQGSSDYHFQGTIASNNVSETQGSLFLRSDLNGQNIFSLTASGSQSGTLPTGDYTLSFLIQGNSMGVNQIFDARTQIDATFTIPSPATGFAIALLPLALLSRRRRLK